MSAYSSNVVAIVKAARSPKFLDPIILLSRGQKGIGQEATIPRIKKDRVHDGLRSLMKRQLSIPRKGMKAKIYEDQSDSISDREQAVLLLLLRDHVVRMRRDRFAYREWVREVKSPKRSSWTKLNFQWPYEKEFDVFNMHQDYIELLDEKALRKGHDELYFKHRDELNKALGYSFEKSYRDIDIVLPRHHLLTRGQRRSILPDLLEICQAGLTAMKMLKNSTGAVALPPDHHQQATNSPPKPPNLSEKKLYNQTLHRLGEALGIVRFIIDPTSGQPRDINKCKSMIPFPKKNHFAELGENDLFSLEVLGVVGAVYRDGGMEAVGRVLFREQLALHAAKMEKRSS